MRQMGKTKQNIYQVFRRKSSATKAPRSKNDYFIAFIETDSHSLLIDHQQDHSIV